jgi:hypothetical protein
VGCGGETFGSAGAFVPVRQPRHSLPTIPFGDDVGRLPENEGVHIMASINEAQSEPSVPENPLNGKFDTVRISPQISEIAARHLNRLSRALQGIDSITQILIADGVENDNCGLPLEPYLAGGLLIAANTLAEFAASGIEELSSWQDEHDQTEARTDHE